MTTATKRETANGVAGAAEKLQTPAAPTPWERLRAPFPDSAKGTLPKPYRKDAQKGKCKECGKWHGLPAAHLTYVGHADITDRLLAVDPQWNWEPVALDAAGMPLMVQRTNGVPVGLWIRLTVCGVTRLGFGSVEPGAFEPEKQLIGDALRNAAMRFGVGLDMWRHEEAHAPEVEPVSEPAAQGTAKPAGEKLTVVERAPVGRSCPRHECEGVLEAVTWSNGQTKICCDHWRKEQGGCRYRESVPVEDAGADDIVPVDSTAEIPFG